MILVVGGALSGVSIHCESNPMQRISFHLRCLRFGAGLGAGLSTNNVHSLGCNSVEAMNKFAGSGAFGSGSLGILTAGAGTSTETWGVWSAGLGIGLGLEVAAGGEYCWVDP
jgi:hypothetical protein